MKEMIPRFYERKPLNSKPIFCHFLRGLSKYVVISVVAPLVGVSMLIALFAPMFIYFLSHPTLSEVAPKP